MKSKGFTLIELMIVLSIISILIVLIVGSVSIYRNRNAKAIEEGEVLVEEVEM